ncbi:hypothetical protein [Actinoplanes sp. NPDC026670]|uniref:hypothetical protein n=1 Tax=Actinoplanes sp. NPDC026670 TaxID=3154700 RepID=UPI0033D0B178
MAEPRRWTRVSAMAFGILLAGIVGAHIGSWVAGRDSGALPGNDQALQLVREILPESTATTSASAEIDRRDYLYGSPLGDEEYGPGYVEVSLGGDADTGCLDDRIARERAAAHGWTEPRDIAGFVCPGWNAQRGDLVMAYVQQGSGLTVTFYRSTTGSTVGALAGAVAGGLAGFALFRPLSRRPLAVVAALIPPALALIPVMIVFAVAIGHGGLEGPTPQLWSVWPALARLAG